MSWRMVFERAQASEKTMNSAQETSKMDLRPYISLNRAMAMAKPGRIRGTRDDDGRATYSYKLRDMPERSMATAKSSRVPLRY